MRPEFALTVINFPNSYSFHQKNTGLEISTQNSQMSKPARLNQI